MAVVVQGTQFWADWPNASDEVFDVRAKSSKPWISAESEIIAAGQSRVIGHGTISALRPTLPNITLPATSAGLDDQTARWTVTLHRTGSENVIATVLDDFPLPVSFEPATTWAQIKINKQGKQPLRDTSVYTKIEVNNLLSLIGGDLNDAGLAIKGRTRLSVAPLSASDPVAVGDNDLRLPTFISSAYATLNAAVTAIGSTPGTLFVASASFLSNSCTIPSTLVLDFGNVGSLSIATGQTVTILSDGSLWPLRKLFYGLGSVTFAGNAAMNRVQAKWFVTGDGTDESIALQAAVDSLYRKFLLEWTPELLVKTTVPLRIWTKQELNFVLPSATYYPDAPAGIDYFGADGTEAVQIYNTFGTLWDGIKVRINQSANVAQTGIDIDQFADGTLINGRAIVGQVCSENTVQNVNITAVTNNGANTTGVRLAYNSGINCENMRFENIAVQINGLNANVASNANRGCAFKIGGNGGGNNAFQTVFDRVNWTNASYGIYAPQGDLSVGAWEGQAATLDFYINNPTHAQINFGRSEGARQLLIARGGVVLIGNSMGNGAWDAAYPLISGGPTFKLTMISNEFNAQVGIKTVDADPADSASITTIGGSWAEGANGPDLSNFTGGAVALNDITGRTLRTLNGSPQIINDSQGGAYDSYLQLRDAAGSVKFRLAQRINRDSDLFTNWYTRAGTPHKDVLSESGWHLNLHNSNDDAGSIVGLYYIPPATLVESVSPFWGVSGMGLTNVFKGADVASASAIVPTGNVFHVTGVTTITSITSTGIAAGTRITIIFDGVLTVVDGNNLKLAGDFVTSANATLALEFDGSNFYEVSRSAN